ncbi:MAG: hypothetical protein RBU30_13700 [Polyangia bacterium]|nr:hypothetical protein [Polyangia bacterium]
MRTRLLLVFALLLLVAPDASARKRRGPQGTGQITGQLQLTFAKPQAEPSRAYWSFGVDDLQTRRPPLPWGEIVVFLDLWEEEALPDRVPSELVLEGAEVAPPLLVLPRTSDAIVVAFRNEDGLSYQFKSQDHAELRSLIIPPKARENVKMEGIPHLSSGKPFERYRIETVTKPQLRAEILMLRSTAFAKPSAEGQFSLAKLSAGKRVLKVYHRGVILLEKPVEVGRGSLDLGTLKITLGESK